MGILSKIITAIRGGAQEAGQAFVDTNSIRILEQEVRDAEANLNSAKSNLTKVMAEQMQADRKIVQINDSISEHESYAKKALEQKNHALALEVAEKIATLENEQQEHIGIRDNFATNIARLKEVIRKTERTITDYKRQLSIVKTNDSVQKASTAISNSFSGSASKLTSAMSSLVRIKKHQQEFDDRLAASEQLASEGSDASLNNKLEAAGIKSSTSSSAEDVLARLEKQ